MIRRRKLILSYTIPQVIPNICTKFQNPRLSSSWEISDKNFPMYYIGVRDGKKKDKINLSILVFFPSIYLKTLAVIVQKSVTENLIGEKKKNGQINAMINRRRLILSNAIQQVIPNICTKFHNPRQYSSWEIFDTNFPMHYIGVRDGEKEKEGKN